MDLSNLVNSCEFVDNMLSFGNEAEIMTINKMMVGRLHAMNLHKSELDPRENDTIDFIPHDDPLKVRQHFPSLLFFYLMIVFYAFNSSVLLNPFKCLLFNRLPAAGPKSGL